MAKNFAPPKYALVYAHMLGSNFTVLVNLGGKPISGSLLQAC